LKPGLVWGRRAKAFAFPLPFAWAYEKVRQPNFRRTARKSYAVFLLKLFSKARKQPRFLAKFFKKNRVVEIDTWEDFQPTPTTTGGAGRST